MIKFVLEKDHPSYYEEKSLEKPKRMQDMKAGEKSCIILIFLLTSIWVAVPFIEVGVLEEKQAWIYLGHRKAKLYIY